MSRNDVRLPYPQGVIVMLINLKPNKPLIIISILVAVIAITLISVFIFLKHQLSPEQSVDQISDALKKKTIVNFLNYSLLMERSLMIIKHMHIFDF